MPALGPALELPQANNTIEILGSLSTLSEWLKGYVSYAMNPAPFKDEHGEPFLETHHIKWMAKDGKDTIENTIALCPNCHRRMHILNDASDIQLLITKKR